MLLASQLAGPPCLWCPPDGAPVLSRWPRLCCSTRPPACGRRPSCLCQPPPATCRGQTAMPSCCRWCCQPWSQSLPDWSTQMPLHSSWQYPSMLLAAKAGLPTERRQLGEASGTRCTAQHIVCATGLLAVLLPPRLQASSWLRVAQCSSVFWGESAISTLQPTLTGL